MRGTDGRVRRSAPLLTVLSVVVGALALVLAVSATRVVSVEHDRSVADSAVISDVRYYDEVLTMSARQAAATGDPQWEVRYRAAESALAASLEGAAADASPDVVGELAGVSQANEELVALEERSLALAAAGRLVEARAVLDGPDYDRLKSEYAAELAAATARAEQIIDGQARRWQVMAAAFVLLVLGGALVAVLLARRTSRRVAAAQRTLREVMESSVVGQAVSDADGRFTYVNPALCDLLGVDETYLLGRTPTDLLLPGDDRTALAHARFVDGTLVHEHTLTAGGARPWVRHVVRATTDDAGRDMQVHQFVDETEPHSLQQELAYRAGHDSLTGLLNRTELIDLLEHRLHRSGVDRLGVLFVDVDRLKPVNDEIGHAAGDALLQAVSARLRASVRNRDVVARVGGDEFVVLLDGVTGVEEAEAVAHHVHASTCGTVSMDGREIEVSVSVGVAIAAADDDADRVLARADEQMYVAKRSGIGVSTAPASAG